MKDKKGEKESDILHYSHENFQKERGKAEEEEKAEGEGFTVENTSYNNLEFLGGQVQGQGKSTKIEATRAFRHNV